VFGELEFWFSSIKVITLTGLIIFGIVVGQFDIMQQSYILCLILVPDLGGNPHGDRIGFRHWQVICLVTQHALEILSNPSRNPPTGPMGEYLLDVVQNVNLARFLGFWSVMGSF